MASLCNSRTLGLAEKSVICEHWGMMKPRVKELVEAAGISKSYASDILSGKQAPSRAAAIHIFRRTGWKHPLIAELTNEVIDVLETVEPWPRQQDAAA